MQVFCQNHFKAVNLIYQIFSNLTLLPKTKIKTFVDCDRKKLRDLSITFNFITILMHKKILCSQTVISSSQRDYDKTNSNLFAYSLDGFCALHDEKRHLISAYQLFSLLSCFC